MPNCLWTEDLCRMPKQHRKIATSTVVESESPALIHYPTSVADTQKDAEPQTALMEMESKLPLDFDDTEREEHHGGEQEAVHGEQHQPQEAKAVTASVAASEDGSDKLVEHARKFQEAIKDDVALTFPQRLLEILEDESCADIIAWLPHGRAFVIYRKKEFENMVLPKYFHKQSKYSSFTRKLNRWGFVRVTRGPETGAYYHPLFKRGDHRLVMQMSCHSATAKKSVAAVGPIGGSLGGSLGGQFISGGGVASMNMGMNMGMNTTQNFHPHQMPQQQAQMFQMQPHQQQQHRQQQQQQQPNMSMSMSADPHMQQMAYMQYQQQLMQQDEMMMMRQHQQQQAAMMRQATAAGTSMGHMRNPMPPQQQQGYPQQPQQMQLQMQQQGYSLQQYPSPRKGDPSDFDDHDPHKDDFSS